MKIERRDCTRADVRMEGDDEARKFTGYAAVFYRDGEAGTEYELWGGAVERIMPGAFDDALKNDDVRALFNHSPNLVLGRTSAGTLRLTVDDVGLRYEIDADDTNVAHDVASHLKRGDVNGSSFGFNVTNEEWINRGEDDTVRLIRSVQLFDVGPVTFPAYVATDAGMRAGEDGITEARASHDAWQADQDERASRMRKKNMDMRLKPLDA